MIKANNMFSQQDTEQIKKHQLSLEEIQKQIASFKSGFPKLKITKAAIIGDGIQKFDNAEREQIIKEYEQALPSLDALKFVPASGAATRMFKELFDFYNKTADEQKQIIASQSKPEINLFFNNIEQFAFYNDFVAVLKSKGLDIQTLLKNQDYKQLLQYYLTDAGLNYGSLPKALLQFHCYNGYTRTAIEEHLIEGALYCKGKNNEVHIHFTVSPEHRNGFTKHIDEVKSNYEKKYGVTYNISYSEQEPSTDTIAVDLNNEPFRNNDNSLLFRPGGHGALLNNLNRFAKDCILIKNIDNLTTDRFNETTIINKKLIGGLLLRYKQKIFNYIKQLEQNSSESLFNEIEFFFLNELSLIMPCKYQSMTKDEKAQFLFQKLNRPIRVCGMVKNEGDTGGGPFWAVNSDGSTSLQIAETSQIDLEDKNAKAIFDSATHFNPADIALCTKNYKGEKFDLMPFRDSQTGFISKKSKDGKDLKALELPGLWNGSMSDWNTVFVDVPLITFNPVKTINDLLKDEHRG
jgi:hypothetical protein